MSSQPDIAVDLRTIKGKLHFSIRTGLIEADDVKSLVRWLDTLVSLDDYPGCKPTIAVVPLTVPWVDPVHEYDQWAESRRQGLGTRPPPSWDSDEIDLLADLSDGKPFHPKTKNDRRSIRQLVVNGDVTVTSDGFVITVHGIESLKRLLQPWDVTVKDRERAPCQLVDTPGTASPIAGTDESGTVE